MSHTVFIAGTDTGVGKTWVSCGLLRAARARGVAACGYKPVAAGSRLTPAGLVNEDAQRLLAASAPGLSLARINPYTLREPIAPHLAAANQGLRLSTTRLDAAHRWLAARHELVLVEGAGGWLVPLDARRTMADWVAARGWPVILVVGLRLGCLNHALLSAEAITRRAPLLGWIANRLPPSQRQWQANVETLRARMPAPLLGIADARRQNLDTELQQVISRLGM